MDEPDLALGVELRRTFRARVKAKTTRAPRTIAEVWEDYGLLRGVGAFLGALQEDHPSLALRELSGIIAELRRARLDDQLARALTLRKAVLAPWG